MISCSFNALREWVRATCHSPATSGISWPLNLESYMQLTVIFLFSFPLCRCCPRLFVSVWVCYWLKNGVVIGGNVLAFCLLPPSFFFSSLGTSCAWVSCAGRREEFSYFNMAASSSKVNVDKVTRLPSYFYHDSLVCRYCVCLMSIRKGVALFCSLHELLNSTARWRHHHFLFSNNKRKTFLFSELWEILFTRYVNLTVIERRKVLLSRAKIFT